MAVEHPTLTASALRIDRGSEDAVLLVHGLGGGPYEVQRLAEALTLTSHCVVLPGHEAPRAGRMPHSHWRQWAGLVADSYDALARTHKRVFLVGFSTGSPLVLHLVQERGLHDTKLVLLAPFFRVYVPTWLPVRPEVLLQTFSFLHTAPRPSPPVKDAALRDEVSALIGFRTFSLTSTRSALELISLVRQRLTKVRAKTLIIQGRGDTIVDPTGARLVHAEVTGSRLELVDSNHLLTLDQSAPHVIALAKQFLEG